MKAAVYFNSHKIFLHTAYLMAEYPVLGQTYLQDSKKFKRDQYYYWDSVEISDELEFFLKDMHRQNTFISLEEIAAIYKIFTELARRKTMPQVEPFRA